MKATVRGGFLVVLEVLLLVSAFLVGEVMQKSRFC